MGDRSSTAVQGLKMSAQGASTHQRMLGSTIRRPDQGCALQTRSALLLLAGSPDNCLQRRCGACLPLAVFQHPPHRPVAKIGLVALVHNSGEHACAVTCLVIGFKPGNSSKVVRAGYPGAVHRAIPSPHGTRRSAAGQWAVAFNSPNRDRQSQRPCGGGPTQTKICQEAAECLPDLEGLKRRLARRLPHNIAGNGDEIHQGRVLVGPVPDQQCLHPHGTV